MEKFVAYYRVSTVKQGRSGLGIDAQKRAVSDATKNCTDCIVAEFEEHESGRKNKRPKLKAALKICSDTGATLVIAKLDRLSRNAAFILTLKEKANDKKRPFKILFCDYPNIDDTSLGIMAIMAQNEAKRMAVRQHEANESKKIRGVKLGNAAGLTHEVSAMGVAARKEYRNLDENVINAKITIRKEIEIAQGKNITLTAKEIVKELNRQQIKTIRELDYELSNVRPMIKEVMKEMNIPKLPVGKRIPIPRTTQPKNETTGAKDVATKLREKGHSLQQIADNLNKIGLKTATGKEFQATTIMRLLEKKKA
jgi:DNA invertase Pin-like site-specific DNA recombinase